MLNKLLQNFQAVIEEYKAESSRFTMDSFTNMKGAINPTTVIAVLIVTSLIIAYFYRFVIKLVGFLLLSYLATDFINSRLNVNYGSLDPSSRPTIEHQLLAVAMVYTLIYYRQFFFKLGAIAALLFAVYQVVSKGKYSSVMSSKEIEGFNFVAVLGMIVIIALVFK